MGKAKSGKSNVLKVVSIVAAIVVAVGIIAVFVAPLIPVRKVDESAYKKLDNNDVYERAYNIYGVQIYKDRDKALAQFKADYNDALVYLDEKLGLGEFNTSYDMLSQYGENGWQYTFSADEKRELGEEKVNELKQKMAGISAFVICMRIQTGVIMSDCNKQNRGDAYEERKIINNNTNMCIAGSNNCCCFVH